MTTTFLPRLVNADARRLFLARHCLVGMGRRQAGVAGLEALIERLGFVQIDSVNTVERAHHMILGVRRPSYRPRNLKTLMERQRGLFEHWTHDAAVIPIAFYPHWQLRFSRDSVRLAERWKKWRRDGFEAKFDEVLNHIAQNGPAMAREIGGGEKRANQGWWDWHPSKTALEYLWRTGALAVKGRVGFQKVFDLAERVIPQAQLSARPDPAETIEWACASALERLGFATSGEIAAFWETVTPADAKVWAAAHLGQDLIEIEVEGAVPGAFRRCFARPDVMEAARVAPKPPASVRILSPFDPALRDRKRGEWLFGFRYRIEIFVPEPKRTYGYYVFPILEGDRLIGRIDMKRAGKEGRLDVRAFWPEAGVRLGKGRMQRLEAEIWRNARFAGCDDVQFSDGWVRAPVVRED